MQDKIKDTPLTWDIVREFQSRVRPDHIRSMINASEGKIDLLTLLEQEKVLYACLSSLDDLMAVVRDQPISDECTVSFSASNKVAPTPAHPDVVENAVNASMKGYLTIALGAFVGSIDPGFQALGPIETHLDEQEPQKKEKDPLVQLLAGQDISAGNPVYFIATNFSVNR